MSYVITRDRDVRLTGTTTPVLASGAAIYLTIPGVPVASNLLSVNVGSSTALTGGVKITFLSNGAGYRAATGGAKAGFIQAMVSSSASASSFLIPGASEFLFDATETGNLHLLITAADGVTALPTGAVITVNVKVKAGFYLPEKTPFATAHGYRVLQVTNSGTTVTDISQTALRNGNPYGLGGPSNSQQFTLFSAASDVVYIGFATPKSGVLFTMPSSQINTEGVRWDIATAPATWTPVTVQDNTSDAQATATGLSYCGTVVWGAQSTWVTTEITQDPLVVLAGEVNASTNFVPPLVMEAYPSYFWLRLRPANGATFPNGPIKFIGIQPIA